jgi:hypothetical protein
MRVIASEDYDTALSNKNQAAAQVISAQAVHRRSTDASAANW